MAEPVNIGKGMIELFILDKAIEVQKIRAEGLRFTRHFNPAVDKLAINPGMFELVEEEFKREGNFLIAMLESRLVAAREAGVS